MSGYYDVPTDTPSAPNREAPAREGFQCAWCGNGDAFHYRVDPVQEELYGVIEMKFYHDDCYYESARDI